MSICLIALPDGALTGAQLARVREALPAGMALAQSRDHATIKAVSSDIEIVAGWVRPAWLANMPRLRWLQQWGAGADWLLRYPEIAGRPFILTNASGVHSIQISEHIFAMLLALARNLPNAFAARQAGEWTEIGHPYAPPAPGKFAFTSTNLFELAGSTMLIIGVGAIGERTARLARAFDMRVLGIRNHPERGTPYVDKMLGPDRLNDALPQADFVVMTAPLTPATRHMIGPDSFRRMKETAVLVNIGRGGTVDEAALLTALRDGQIRAAALDVFEEEPLPPDSPLWQQENLLITPHYSGSSPHYNNRALAIFLDNLERFRADAPLRNVVDKTRGY